MKEEIKMAYAILAHGRKANTNQYCFGQHSKIRIISIKLIRKRLLMSRKGGRRRFGIIQTIKIMDIVDWYKNRIPCLHFLSTG